MKKIGGKIGGFLWGAENGKKTMMKKTESERKKKVGAVKKKKN